MKTTAKTIRPETIRPETIRPENIRPDTQSKKSSLSLRARFLFGVAVFLLIVCFISAFLIYHHEKKELETIAHDKTDLVMAAVEAARAYVREELRPKMYAEFGADFFMLEAMSTSYVGRAFMDRFSRTVPDYTFRRVSINARNPQSEADALEREMIDYFRENPGQSSWQGLAEKDGEAGYMRFQPVFFETGCMHCHGRPEDAPAELIRLYGDKQGFGHFPGELAGIIAVGIPVDSALADIRERAASVFIAVFLGVSIFFLFLLFFFDRIVVSNLRGVLDIFRSSLDRDIQPEASGAETEEDEIQALTAAAETMADRLRRNRKVLVGKNLELEQQKELLQSVFDGITDMVVLLDREFRIKMVNRAYLRWYQVTLADVYNIPCHEAHAGNLQTCDGCELRSVAETGKALSTEIRYPDGALFLVTFFPILDEAGKVESIIRYSREITDQKKVEQKIQQAEKLLAMGQLAAGVAHEINNPLGIILCYTDLLKRELADFPQSLKDLDVIEKQTLNSRRIVSDLLQFARSHESAGEPAMINNIIDEVIRLLSHQFQKQNVQVTLDLDAKIPAVPMNVNKIKQVLINLLMNACQAIEGPGAIFVSSAWLTSAKIVEVGIQDSGRGIDPAIRNKIFDPFFSTKATDDSTGLGLSVSYGIVQEHGGEIAVESEPGRGACFTIRIPCQGSE